MKTIGTQNVLQRNNEIPPFFIFRQEMLESKPRLKDVYTHCMIFGHEWLIAQSNIFIYLSILFIDKLINWFIYLFL